jgi:phage shock protein PspC (stress-responsive transcriptional regulator)
MPTPTAPPAPRRILQRNRRRRKLGGVCAGLADYLGMNLTPVRFIAVLLLLLPILGGVTFMGYLALWWLLPAATETPIPEEVSWALGRELRRIDQRVRKLHRSQDAAIADQAQQAFDALKILAPRIEQPGDAPVAESLREAALVRFPKLLDRLIATPANAFVGHGAQQTAAQALLNQLLELNEQLQGAAKDLADREFQASYRERPEESPELAAWREKLDPMRERLRDRTGPETMGVLESIEEKLAFLLKRLAQGEELFDLRPFEVRKIAFDYLPDALNQYLALPSSMARTQRLHSGKTAEESLREQLGLLDNTLRDLAKSLFEKDAGSLLVHGRFLREKFAEQPFRLPD